MFRLPPSLQKWSDTRNAGRCPLVPDQPPGRPGAESKHWPRTSHESGVRSLGKCSGGSGQTVREAFACCGIPDVGIQFSKVVASMPPIKQHGAVKHRQIRLLTLQERPDEGPNQRARIERIGPDAIDTNPSGKAGQLLQHLLRIVDARQKRPGHHGCLQTGCLRLYQGPHPRRDRRMRQAPKAWPAPPLAWQSSRLRRHRTRPVCRGPAEQARPS